MTDRLMVDVWVVRHKGNQIERWKNSRQTDGQMDERQTYKQSFRHLGLHYKTLRIRNFQKFDRFHGKLTH